MVFFKITGDENCLTFDPVFAKFSTTDPSIVCAVLDVKNNPEVTKNARNSSTPITGVPTLLLYINGNPHAKYGGSRNLQSIQAFVNKALESTRPPAQTNIYGGPGAPSDPRFSNMPDIGKAPSMKRVLKADPRSNPNFVDEDRDEKLMVPDSVTPWNVPWETELKEEGF